MPWRLIGWVVVGALAILANLATVLAFIKSESKTFASIVRLLWANITPLSLTLAMLVLAAYVFAIRKKVEDLAEMHDTLLKDAVAAHVITEQRITNEGLIRRFVGDDPDTFIDLSNENPPMMTTHRRVAIDKMSRNDRLILKANYPRVWEWYEKGQKG